MTSQLVSSSSQVVGVFKDRQAALNVQKTIQEAGIPAQQIYIDERINSQQQVEAMGTTMGGEAGLWMGAFYGGIIGVIVVSIIITYQSHVAPTSTFTQLIVVGITIAGAVLGSLSGKSIYAAQSKEQKKKGDPSIPRSFQIMVRGSQDEISRARRAINEASGS